MIGKIVVAISHWGPIKVRISDLEIAANISMQQNVGNIVIFMTLLYPDFNLLLSSCIVLKTGKLTR